jgi:hypothetical protein
VAVFLASPAADYATTELIVVDGAAAHVNIKWSVDERGCSSVAPIEREASQVTRLRRDATRQR